jgi:prevent-host-death family protein
MTTVNMHEAKTRLSQLVAKVEAGEEVVISRDGKPVVKLVRADPPNPPRVKAGYMKDQIWISPDFDEPDPELEALFYDAPIIHEPPDEKSE